MQSGVTRASVDLSSYPELVVVYLGLRVSALKGLAAIFRIGPGLDQIKKRPPDGLLAHEGLLYGWRHIGFRQYWRDLESLEAFTRSEPHRDWWAHFMKQDSGAGFWHETYRLKGGMEAVYLNMPPIGLAAFAPNRAPEGAWKNARGRLMADVAPQV